MLEVATLVVVLENDFTKVVSSIEVRNANVCVKIAFVSAMHFLFVSVSRTTADRKFMLIRNREARSTIPSLTHFSHEQGRC